MDSIDIRVISLKDTTPLLTLLETDFSKNDVQISSAVDMRRVSTDSLVKSGLISLNAADALDTGRKWHKELTSPGTVGLYQSNRMIMQSGLRPLVVFEEDCHYNTRRLKDELGRLVRLGDSIDVAVFGAWQDNKNVVQSTELNGWVKLVRGSFWFTHCVYYSESGRKKMSRHMSSPQEVQYDSYLAFLATRGMLNVYLNDTNDIAWQDYATSTLQTDVCFLCMLPGSRPLLKTTILILACLIVLYVTHKRILVSLFADTHQKSQS